MRGRALRDAVAGRVRAKVVALAVVGHPVVRDRVARSVHVVVLTLVGDPAIDHGLVVADIVVLA